MPVIGSFLYEKVTPSQQHQDQQQKMQYYAEYKALSQLTSKLKLFLPLQPTSKLEIASIGEIG